MTTTLLAPAVPAAPVRGPLCTVTLATTTGPLPCTGELTPTPGLVITPASSPDGATFTGDFVLTHQDSGLRVSWNLPLVYAREAAGFLASTGVDWTRDADDLRDEAASVSIRSALDEAFRRAWHRTRPLRWARTSWVAGAPRWRIWRGDAPTGITFATWTSVLDTAGADRRCGNTLAGSDQIARDVDPSWDLRCAAPFCGPAPLRLYDTADGLIAEYEDYPTSRSGHARIARGYGWSGHGRYWLCPGCAATYRAARR